MISWIQKYKIALSNQLASAFSDRITYSNKCAKWIQLVGSYDIVTVLKTDRISITNINIYTCRFVNEDVYFGELSCVHSLVVAHIV